MKLYLSNTFWQINKLLVKRHSVWRDILGHRDIIHRNMGKLNFTKNVKIINFWPRFFLCMFEKNLARESDF